MKKRIFIVLLSFATIFNSCNNDNFIDTGLSITHEDKTMYDYFKRDSYNWDSLINIINRAELQYMFDGTDSRYKNITVFGPTNFSIVRWMKSKNIKSISAISKEECANYVKKYIVETAYKKSDIDFEIKGTVGGGTEITKINGTKIRVFKRKSDWGAVADGGPVSLHVESFAAKQTIQIASADIVTKTGVVHSLSYTYTFGEF